MRGADNIIPVFSWIVSQMCPIVEIDAIVVDGDNWRIDTCNTYWLRKRKVITITGVEYTIVSFVINESITVSGPSIPTGTWFQITAPEFCHGSRRKVNEERDEQIDVTSEFVYLPIPLVRENRQYDSEVVYTAQVKPICIADYDEEYDTIEDQQRDVIEPMNAMVDVLLQVIDDNEDKFSQDEEDIADVERYEWMNFGDPTIWGKDKLIFEGRLSGVEARFDLNVLPDGVCVCDAAPIVTCAPANVYFNGDLVDTAPSGEDFNLLVKDTTGAEVGTYDEPTKTVTVQEAGAGIDIDINGNDFLIGVNTDQNIEVVGTDALPKGIEVSGKWRIADATPILNGVPFASIPAEAFDNIGIINTEGNPVGTKVSNDMVIGKSFGNVINSDGTLLAVIELPAETTDGYQVSDSNINVNGTPLEPLPAQQTKNISIIDAVDADPVAVIIATDTDILAEIIVPNGLVNVKNSANTTIASQAVKSGGTADVLIANKTARAKNQAGTIIGTAAQVAGVDTDVTVNNIIVTINGEAQPASQAGINLSFSATPIIYIRPQSSGYKTSFLTGDEYYNEVNYPPPAAPAFGIPAFLDPADPKKMLNNNAFGHKQRFTGINGGYYDYSTAQYKLANGTVSDQATTFGTTAANTSYFIDHHTGAGYRWNVFGANTFANLVTTILGLTHAGFTDWFLPSVFQQRSLFCAMNLGAGLTAVIPFNSTGGKTSTPTFGLETINHHMISGSGVSANRADATADAAIAMRWHY